MGDKKFQYLEASGGFDPLRASRKPYVFVSAHFNWYLATVHVRSWQDTCFTSFGTNKYQTIKINNKYVQKKIQNR